jgi:hypothetical protein
MLRFATIELHFTTLPDSYQISLSGLIAANIFTILAFLMLKNATLSNDISSYVSLKIFVILRG